MNRFNRTAVGIITLAVFSGVMLAGCGTASTGAGTNATNTTANTNTASSSDTGSQNTSSQNTSSEAVSVKDGVTNLLALANELKTEISAGDQAKVKENGPKLEDTWSSFEDSVKPKYPDLYAKVEQYLDPTVAGSKSDPLDKQTLLKLDEGLIQALTELSQKAQ
jgi:iron uptake system EfeUOB component EfeO/EfeM